MNESNLDKEEKAAYIYYSALCLSNHHQGVRLSLLFFIFVFLLKV